MTFKESYFAHCEKKGNFFVFEYAFKKQKYAYALGEFRAIYCVDEWQIEKFDNKKDDWERIHIVARFKNLKEAKKYLIELNK